MSSSSQHPLQVTSVRVMSDSLQIGPMHSNVLREKRRELEQKVANSVARLDNEAHDFRNCHDMQQPQHQEQYAAMRQKQQNQINTELQEHQDTMERLYHAFQKEWKANPTCPVEPPHSSALDLRSRYLAESLGVALQSALGEVVMLRPADPIDYLAHWLYRHATEKHYRKQKAIDAYMVRIAEDEEAMAQEKLKFVRLERDRIRTEERRRKDIFMQRMKEAEAQSQETETTLHSEAKTTNDTMPNDTADSSEPTEDISATHAEPVALRTELSTIAEKDKENSVLSESGIGQHASLTDSAKLRQKRIDEETETVREGQMAGNEEQMPGEEEQSTEREDEQ